MIDIRENDIEISHGDTFDVIFQLKGYQIAKEDTVVFSVKKTTYHAETVLRKEFTNFDGGETVRVTITAADMAALEPGEYVYDLLIKSGDTRTTLNFPAKLIVRRVAHD